GLLRYINLSLAQALDQVFRGEVDDLDVVRLVEDAVGHGLAHADPGDPRDDVVEALDMLDVESREHVDARADQLFDIEIALRMSAARRVGVSELVDENELRPPLEDRIQIHLGQEMAFVLDLLPRDYLEAFEKRL